MEEFKNIDQFDDRHLGGLTDGEEQKFQKRLLSDEAFAEEFEFFEDVLDAVELEETVVLQNKLKGIRARVEQISIEEKRSAKIIGFKPWWGIAASFLLLFSLFGYANIYFSNQALSNLKTDKLLFDTNGTRSSEIVIDPFNKGQIALEKQDYQGAISFFEGILKDDGDYAVAQFRLAYAQFQNKQAEKALNTLKIIFNWPNLDENLKEDAEWLEIQSLLVLNKADTEQFQLLLNKIANNTSHNYNTEAIDLQAKKNRFWRKLVI